MRGAKGDFFFAVRLVDDFYDGDIEVKKEDVLKPFFILLADLPTNIFYRKNSDTLTGVHILGFNTWQDANEWEKEDDQLKRIYTHVSCNTS